MKPLLVSIDDAAGYLSIGRNSVIARIGDGTLPSVKVGRRRLVPYAALEALAEGTTNGQARDDPG